MDEQRQQRNCGMSGQLSNRRPHQILLARFGAFLFLGVAAIYPMAILAETTILAKTTEISREQKIKAAYLYHLTKFIDWPSSHPNKQSQSITVCIAGDASFTEFLLQLETRQAKGRPIRIRPVEKTDDTSICQLMFFQSKRTTDDQLLQRLDQQGTLTIGEDRQFIKGGGMIGMIIIDNHVKLQINPRIIKQAGIMVSANLLEVATIVNENQEPR